KDKDKDKDKEHETKEKRKKDDMTSIVPAEPEKAADLTEDFAFGGEAAEMAEKGEAEVMSFQVSLTEEREACRAVIEKWNALGIQPVLRCSPTSKRGRMLRARLREYGLEKLLLALDNVNNSKFLKGAGNNGWVIDFDWFLGPNHFNKVLEGAYNDRRARKAEADPDFDPGEIDRLVISK
ncbi:MAG: hypothetical protein Q4F31_09440, partial [Eubacteriales bacterium]|nr:hypothetical protein [Eubacteriales bacterium]